MMLVRDAMTVEVVTVAPTASLKDVAKILAERHISGLLVVDSGGRVIGVVSEGDILVKAMPPGHRPSRASSWLFARAGLHFERTLAAKTAGEAMTSPATVIDHDRQLAEAAALMFDHAVSRLPVVHRGRLVGIVTRADIVCAFARSDEEIAREIREDVLLETFLLSSAKLKVKVSRGEVTLAGAVPRKDDVQLIPALVKRVPGVVSVRSTLVSRQAPASESSSSRGS